MLHFGGTDLGGTDRYANRGRRPLAINLRQQKQMLISKLRSDLTSSRKKTCGDETTLR